MKLWRRRFRSAGINVTSSAHRAIAAGDRARAAGHWAVAAERYAEAIAEMPELVHVHIQLGHALKEAGRLCDAEQAYVAAYTRQPGDREAAMQLGHVLKIQGHYERAAELYVALALADPHDGEAMREACNVLASVGDDQRTSMAQRLSTALVGDDAAVDDDLVGFAECAIVFDVSDLISFFGHSRRPTGIQRVQTEVIVHVLRQQAEGRGPKAGICCFIDGRDEWVEVPAAAFLDLVRGSVGGDDDARIWEQSRNLLRLRLLVAPPVVFRRAATLVNLGTSWWLQNYFLHIRDAQARFDLIYVPLVHDMIPVLFPDFCTEQLVRDFVSWVENVFAHTASFLSVSYSSKRDLIATARTLGYSIGADDVEVIGLDAAPDSSLEPTCAILPAHGLDKQPFILFVSTIEPRKGHLIAFDAWSRLIDDAEGREVPRLVCVGRNGWRNEAVFERLANDPVLAAHVAILSDLSDSVLATLYERSLFTIYPSLYEGWGLPVTEALSRGKLVVTTTSSSLPEAGGSFARYVPPGDSAALAAEVSHWIRHRDLLEGHERIIAQQYRPAGWAEVATRTQQAVAQLSQRVQERSQGGRRGVPPIQPGVFYWLGRSLATHLHRRHDSGEVYRAGRNWQAPDTAGCRIKRSGALLRVPLPLGSAGSTVEWRMTLRLFGSEFGNCPYRVETLAGQMEGVLAREERLSLVVALAPDPSGEIEVRVSGQVEDAAMPDTVVDTLGIEGFVVHCH